jgi:DNA-binding Lrp family transcriptional regulator
MRELLRADATPPNIRRSFRAIAHRLRVDENTIRNRVEKLRKSGFLKGWLLGVNPNLLGERVARLWFDVQPQSDKANTIRKISLVQGVELILDYFGASLSAMLCYEDEQILNKSIELIARIANSDNIMWAKVPFPTPTLTLTPKDWMIIGSLQKDPWKPFVDIARELDLSSITIKRRLAKMNQSGAFYLMVDIDPKAVEGNLLGHLVVFYDVPDSRYRVNEKISEYLGDQIAFADTDDTEHGFFALMITNISKIQEILGWVKQQQGVKSARFDVLQDIITFPSMHESRIQKGLRMSKSITFETNKQTG